MRYLLVLLLWVSMSVLAQDEENAFSQNKPFVHVEKEHPQFVIQLKANPTTGYRWYLRDYNSDLVQPLSHRYVASTNKKLVGAPGMDYWTFKMKPAAFAVPHQTNIRFVYARAWESNETNPTQVTFKVTT